MIHLPLYFCQVIKIKMQFLRHDEIMKRNLNINEILIGCMSSCLAPTNGIFCKPSDDPNCVLIINIMFNFFCQEFSQLWITTQMHF